jgi:hypothetical protein
MTQHGARGMIRPRSFRGRGTGSCDVAASSSWFGRGPMCRHRGPARQRAQRRRCGARSAGLGLDPAGSKGSARFWGTVIAALRAHGADHAAKSLALLTPGPRERERCRAPSPPPDEPWRLQSRTPRLLSPTRRPARHPRGPPSPGTFKFASSRSCVSSPPTSRRPRSRPSCRSRSTREDASAQRLRQARRPQAHRGPRPSKGPRRARRVAEGR